jgi:hypothetical protein
LPPWAEIAERDGEADAGALDRVVVKAEDIHALGSDAGMAI